LSYKQKTIVKKSTDIEQEAKLSLG